MERSEAMIFCDSDYAENLTRIGYNDRVCAVDNVSEFHSRDAK